MQIHRESSDIESGWCPASAVQGRLAACGKELALVSVTLLRWKLSDDNRYADKIVETLDAWSSMVQQAGSSQGED